MLEVCVTAAKLNKEFGLLKWDQQVVSKLVEKLRSRRICLCTQDIAKKIRIKILHAWWLHLKFPCSNREVIENGATLPKTKIVEGREKMTPITSVEDKAQRRLEVKARSSLMIGIPNEHRLMFNSIKDAKKLLETIKKRFGRNEATKKTQRNLLKQQYENFTASSLEMLDQTFDRL
ncbi:hypothetical protein Tco_1429474 [Tanacetum coccineum]